MEATSPTTTDLPLPTLASAHLRPDGAVVRVRPLGPAAADGRAQEVAAATAAARAGAERTERREASTAALAVASVSSGGCSECDRPKRRRVNAKRSGAAVMAKAARGENEKKNTQNPLTVTLVVII